MGNVISTGMGDFSKEKFNALLNVRSAAMTAIRTALSSAGFTEVSTSSLVNIAGSCENPYASFSLPFYGREAHLSQSAQLQLEAIVMRLRRSVFTVNSSFREENFDDPEAEGRRLSEFTLIEPEMPLVAMGPEAALDAVIQMQELVLKASTRHVLETCEKDVTILGGDPAFLARVVDRPFNRLTYDDALAMLNNDGGKYAFGDDLGIKEERNVLAHFDNQPTFVTHFPTSLKFFNMKRMEGGDRVYSVDLLMPRLGETTGGAVREEDGAKIKQYLLSSRIAEKMREMNVDVVAPFEEYFSLFEQEPETVRAGFGIGFERYVGFLINSNDILASIAYRTMQPPISQKGAS